MRKLLLVTVAICCMSSTGAMAYRDCSSIATDPDHFKERIDCLQQDVSELSKTLAQAQAALAKFTGPLNITQSNFTNVPNVTEYCIERDGASLRAVPCGGGQDKQWTLKP
jgi:hypothetical protein